MRKRFINFEAEEVLDEEFYNEETDEVIDLVALGIGFRTDEENEE